MRCQRPFGQCARHQRYMCQQAKTPDRPTSTLMNAAEHGTGQMAGDPVPCGAAMRSQWTYPWHCSFR